MAAFKIAGYHKAFTPKMWTWCS